MSGLKYFDMKIEYDHMVSKISGLNDRIAALEAENAKLREKIDQQDTYIEMCLADLAEMQAESSKLRERVERYKEAVSSVLKCGECNLYHGYICPMCARGLQALKGGE